MPSIRSPRYTFTIASGAIAAGGVYQIELERNERYADNAPYNNVLIRNFSTQRLEVTYGDTKQIMGGSEVMNDTSAYGTRRILIKNLSAVATDDIIFVMVSRDVSSDACIIAETTGESIYSIANGVS